MSKTIKARIEKLETDQEPEGRITVSWRNDGMVECDLPGGGSELITEAEFKARGGKIVRWVDHELTKEDRKKLH